MFRSNLNVTGAGEPGAHSGHKPGEDIALLYWLSHEHTWSLSWTAMYLRDELSRNWWYHLTYQFCGEMKEKREEMKI